LSIAAAWTGVALNDKPGRAEADATSTSNKAARRGRVSAPNLGFMYVLLFRELFESATS
jgi:hypothetical protein